MQQQQHNQFVIQNSVVSVNMTEKQPLHADEGMHLNHTQMGLIDQNQDFSVFTDVFRANNMTSEFVHDLPHTRKKK